MSQHLICHCLCDITQTDVRGRFRPDSMPMQDRTGQWICDQDSWLRARNQQRNFETLIQIISLRTLPEAFDVPSRSDHGWRFGFQIPTLASVAWGADPVGALKYDADGVPMITGLGEPPGLGAEIRTYGPDINVWFDVLDGK